MKPQDCPKLDECYKVKMILDKDLLDFQYAEAIRMVCAKCPEVHQGKRGFLEYSLDDVSRSRREPQ